MHELGLCESVLAAVEERADGRPVQRIGVRVAAQLRVVPEAFAHAFALVAADSIADGAEAELVIVPLSATCRGCGHAFESTEPVPACPECGSVALQGRASPDLILEWVQYHPASREGAA